MGTSWVLILFPIAGLTGSEAESPLAAVVEAHGGLGRFRSIRSWHIVADRRIEHDTAHDEVYEEYLLRDGELEKTLLVKKREGSLLVFGHDGRRGFALADGRLRDDPGAEEEGYYRAHGEYYLRSLPFKWLDPGMSVAAAGSETSSGKRFQLFRITAEENVGRAWKDVWIAAIDAETRLLSEARLTHHLDTDSWMDSRETGTMEIVYRYSDYRSVAGLLVAHRLEYYSGGRKTGENVIRSIQVDGGVEAEIFDPSFWSSTASPERRAASSPARTRRQARGDDARCTLSR